MRKLLHIGIGIAVLLFAAACTRVEDPDVVLKVYLNIPELGLTKTDPGEVAAETINERSIKDLKFWVFLHGSTGSFSDGHKMGFKQVSDYTYSGATEFTIPLDKKSARVANLVDVYILANAPSVNMSALDENTSRSDLDALVLNGTIFGRSASGAPSVTEAGLDGLPYSAVGKGLPLTDEYPTLSVNAMQLKRAVSRVQFIFSKSSKSQKTFAVTDLQLDAHTIANEECVFNDSANPYKIIGDASADASYVSLPMLLATPTSINGCEDPADYAYTSTQTGTEYRTLINTGITNNKLTKGATCYLRESARPLSGKIQYTIDGTAGEASFNMQPTEVFSRNRSWIVYIYFYDDDIRLSVSWTGWTDGFEKELNAQ